MTPTTLKNTFPTKFVKQTESQLVVEPFEEKITIDELNELIPVFPYNSYAVFFNDVFEDMNFVFILSGEWKFFDSHTQQILDWNWIKDVEEIYSIHKDDPDMIDEFNNGWSYEFVYENEYPEHADHLIKLLLTDGNYDLIHPNKDSSYLENIVKAKISNILSRTDIDNDIKTTLIFEIFQ